MFSLGYAWNELRRRWGRTLVTAIGLAAGVGLVMGIIGVSQGLSDAQNRVLSPLGSVGTDIIVTRTVAPTTSADHAPRRPRPSAGAASPAAAAVAEEAEAASSPAASPARAQQRRRARRRRLCSPTTPRSSPTSPSSVRPGTQFTHDFFVPGTLHHLPLGGGQRRREDPGRDLGRRRALPRGPARERHRPEDHRHGARPAARRSRRP